MTRVVRFTADPLQPAPICLSLQDTWWWLASAAVDAGERGLRDLARHYAAACRQLIVAAGQPSERLHFDDVPARQRVA